MSAVHRVRASFRLLVTSTRLSGDVEVVATLKDTILEPAAGRAPWYPCSPPLSGSKGSSMTGEGSLRPCPWARFMSHEELPVQSSRPSESSLVKSGDTTRCCRYSVSGTQLLLGVKIMTLASPRCL